MRSIKLPSWSEKLLGLDPRPVPPHVFGIERERLRYGLFPSRNGHGVQFSEYHSVDLPDDCFLEGPLGGLLRDPAVLREAVADLLVRVSVPVAEASLVLPDDWFRLSFAESEELPRKLSEREEVLRWKLKLQVPFRVEDLRLSATEVPPLAGQEEPLRVLMGFGVSQLLEQVEDAFLRAEVRVGHISNQSLSLLTALRGALSGLDLAAVALVQSDGYSLLITSRGEPLVHRFKSYQEDLPPDAMRRFVQRDLRLTRTFLSEKMGDDAVQRIVLVSPPEAEPVWSEWLAETFGPTPTLLGEEWPFLQSTSPNVAAFEVAPLFGAACREVT